MNRTIASLALIFFLAGVPVDADAARPAKTKRAAKKTKAAKKGKGEASAEATAASTAAADSGASPAAAAPAADGQLVIDDQQVGKGKEAKAGMQAVVHYTGWLTNGTKFDSSRDEGRPFEFPLGAGQVIKGWDEGVAGMKVGGKRKLTIPPAMGYGEKGVGNQIPPNSTLVFEVELLDVK